MDDQPKKGTRGRRANSITTTPIFVDRVTAAAAFALSVSTFEREVTLGKLPKPRKLSGARVGWLWSELLEAAAALPVSDLLPPENTGAPKPRRRQAANDPAPPVRQAG